MKKTYYKVLCFFYVLITIFIYIDCSAYADTTDNYMSFNNITTNDGLSQGSVDAIFQDSDGYMWFATNDGLNRYDGNEFKVFKGDNNDSNTIWPGLVSSISEDKFGDIWVGTGGGVAKINKKTFEVKRFYVDKSDAKKVSNQSIVEIFVDSNKNIWIATEDGLNLYSYLTGEFKKYFFYDQINSENKKNSIIAIEEDDDGNILVASKDNIGCVDKIKEKIVDYKNSRESILANKNIIDMYKCVNNNIWISTSCGEIYKYDLKKNKIVFEKKINEVYKKEDLFVRTIGGEADGSIWFGTNNGLYKYYDETDEFFKYVNKPYDLKTLVNNTISSIYTDRTGLVWVGTLNGISMINPQQKFINYQKRFGQENTLSGKSISGVYEDEFGDLWIGTNVSGLNKLDRKKDIYSYYKYDENNENSILSNNVWQVTGDKKGNVWVATKEGLSKIDIKTNKITNYVNDKENKNSLSNNDVREIFIDDKGLIWIGTRNGLDVFNPKNNTFTNLNHIIINSGINELFVRRIFQDSKGNYWLAAGWHSGLLKLDVKSKQIKVYNHNKEGKSFLSDNMVMGINEGLNGDIWVATTNGLNKIEYDTDQIISYKEKDGMGNSYAYGVLVDDIGNIWVSTNGGISKLDVETNKFENYTYIDGLQSNEFNVTSDFKSKSGEMFFGGVDGVSSFMPNELNKSEKKAENVIISEMHVYNNSNIKYSELVELNYNENNFTINFILPEYRDPGSVKYEYILEGFDEEWVLAENRRDAIYTNIPPGKYNFKVRAKLKGGNISKETTFKIVVKKPWYISNIAISTYFAILIMIIFLCINYVKILDNLVRQKTLQLNAEIFAKDKLHEEKETLYEELLMYEKFRNTYLVNLSHELRTPLNVILSSQQLISSLNNSENGIDNNKINKYMEIIKSNSKNLLEVINDLIDSSKIKSGAYNITFEKNDIVYIVEEVALSMKSFVENEGLELTIDPEIEEKIIDCSKKDIERCVINLISNSVKFTEQGSIYISIREDGDFVEISVKDSGKGISKEDQSIIFDRFTQIEEGVSSKHFSSGIGLNLVKDFVELHKGKVSLVSELGKGSEFIIRLPINIE